MHEKLIKTYVFIGINCGISRKGAGVEIQVVAFLFFYFPIIFLNIIHACKCKNPPESSRVIGYIEA